MNTNIFNEVIRAITTKESVKLMRDATAVSVAGSVVGIAIRNGLYSRSKKKGGWYAKYIDLPFNKKWCKADDKAVLASAVIATALDTILLLDRSGVIKLHSIEEDSDEDLLEEARKAQKETAEMAANIKGWDNLDDEDEDTLY